MEIHIFAKIVKCLKMKRMINSMIIRDFCDNCITDSLCETKLMIMSLKNIFSSKYPNIILDICCSRFKGKSGIAYGLGSNNLIFDDDNLKQCIKCIHNDFCHHKPIKEIDKIGKCLSAIYKDSIKISVSCRSFFEINNSNPIFNTNNQCIIGYCADSSDDKFIVGGHNTSKVKVRKVKKRR